MRFALMPALIALALPGCGVETTKVTYRKLTVVVDTPSGPVTGYSINASHMRCRPTLAGSRCAVFQNAEAVPVDLPNGKTLYALLSKGSNLEWTIMAPPEAWREKDLSVLHRHYNTGFGPDLVIFDEDTNPISAREVSSIKPFSDNYIIKEIYLSKSNGPATKQLKARLPWLYNKTGYFSGKSFPNLYSGNIADRLSSSNFIRNELND